MHLNVDISFSGAFPIFIHTWFIIASIIMYLQCNNNFSIFIQLIDSFVKTVSLSLIRTIIMNEIIAAEQNQTGKEMLIPINDHKANSIR